MSLTSDQIWELPVIVGKMGKPDECGFMHQPAERIFIRRFADRVIEQRLLGTFCLVCGMRLEDIDD